MPECALCGLPTPDPPVTAEGVEGAFCCRGCLHVARTLPDPEAADPDAARSALDAGDPDAEGDVAYLSVSGMHCATCEAYVEAVATDEEGVLGAEASYPAGLVKLTYDPDRIGEADLPSVVEGMGYRARGVEERGEDEGTESAGRLLVGGFFGMMVMAWYVLFLYPAYVGVDPGVLLLDVTGPAGRYLIGNVAVMSGVVLGYTGFPILRGAYVSLRAGVPNMDLLVALAATTAYAYSLAVALTGGTEVYFDIAVVIVLAVTVGNRYEGAVRRRAADRLTRLTEERADAARRRTDGGTEEIAVADLAAGDEVVVRPGERVPIDGVVVEGEAALDESLVTGESLPEPRGPGDEVVGGSLVVDGALVVEVGSDAESTLDRLAELLWEVRSTRPGVQRLADRLAAAFVPVVLGLALLTGGAHLLGGAAPTRALLVGLSVLVVSCPCALGLATPLAVAAGTNRALAGGIVVADGSVFERSAEADVVAFDKTGTLTTGRMRVIETVGDGIEYAAAVEALSDHPVAEAIAAHAPAPDLAVSGFERHPGRGVSATVEGERVVVGRPDLLESEGIDVPEGLRDRATAAADAGRVATLVGVGGEARGLVVAGDEPRPGWEKVVSDLAEDRRVVVITGDGEGAAARFREHPGVEEVFAGVPPEGKTAVIERLREGGTVAMVGDGVNDAPALAAADVGVALAEGAELAASAADAVVLSGDLSAVPEVFAVTAATRRRIRENLGWAFLYNAVAVPAAAIGLLNPLVAAVAMAASSLLVVGNSTRSLGTPRDGGQPRQRDG